MQKSEEEKVKVKGEAGLMMHVEAESGMGTDVHVWSY